VAILFTSGNPRNSVTPWPLPEKAFRRRKPGGIPLRNPYCLSVASLRILGISHGFSAFGGLGPRPFVTFGAMPKVKGPFLMILPVVKWRLVVLISRYGNAISIKCL